MKNSSCFYNVLSESFCTCFCGLFSASCTRISSTYAPRTPQKFRHNGQEIISQNQAQKDSESTSHTFHNLCCMGSMWKNRWNYAWKEETYFRCLQQFRKKYSGTAVVSLVAPFTEDCGLFRDRTKRSYPVRHGFRCSNRKKY